MRRRDRQESGRGGHLLPLVFASAENPRQPLRRIQRRFRIFRRGDSSGERTPRRRGERFTPPPPLSLHATPPAKLHTLTRSTGRTGTPPESRPAARKRNCRRRPGAQGREKTCFMRPRYMASRKYRACVLHRAPHSSCTVHGTVGAQWKHSCPHSGNTPPALFLPPFWPTPYFTPYAYGNRRNSQNRIGRNAPESPCFQEKAERKKTAYN